MKKSKLIAVAIATFAACLPVTDAFAHCFVGNRFFPATLNVDDPCVADEASLPTIAGFKTGDDPSSRELDVSVELSKRITENFGVSLGETWIHLKNPDGTTAQGFDNLATAFKYQFLTDPVQEFVMSASVDIDWGHTGSKAIDAEPFTTLTPTLFVGKGLGFLPEDVRLLRPFALTAQIGYSVPTQTSTSAIDADTGALTTNPNPRNLVWGGSIQYSMPYLKSAVLDAGLPDFVNRIIPIVEWSLQTQTDNFDGGKRTTGTINPGLIYVADSYQLSVEAIIPVNRASGDDVGVMGQLHLYLDDIFPTTYGQPIFTTANR